MDILDLRTKQCPMALLTLKRFLLLENGSVGQPISSQLRLLFSNKQAMQDIILYLDKKGYHYSAHVLDGSVSLVIQFR